MVDQIIVGFEDAVREPVVTHELPDVLDWVEFWAFRRQGEDGDIGGNDQSCRQVPPSLIDEQDGMGPGRDHFSDLGEVQVHCFGVACGQHQGCSLALLGTDRAEDVGGGGALVSGGGWACAALGPAAGDLVLLADARFVLEPDFYCIAVDLLCARDIVQARGEVFLKSSIAPSAWA